MADGMEGFRQLLTQFRASAAWATGALAAVPFATALADLSPPWPPGIVVLTAIVQLLVLALAYTACGAWSRRRTLLAMCAGLVLAALAAGAYLQQLSAHTYRVPTTGERFAMGTRCTRDAQVVFAHECPALGIDALRSAEYTAARLWTQASIDAVRLRLVALWSIAFAALAWTLGAFFVFQTWRATGAGRTAGPGGPRPGAPQPGAPAPLFGRIFGTPAPPDAPPVPPRAAPPRPPMPPPAPHPVTAPDLPASAGVEPDPTGMALPEPEAAMASAPGPADAFPESAGGDRLLGGDAAASADDASTDAGDGRWINARIEDHPDHTPLVTGTTYTLSFAVERTATSTVAGGSVASELPAAGAEYAVKVQLDSPDFRIDDPVRTLRIAADGLSSGKARFDVVPLHDGACTLTATLLKDGNFAQQLVLRIDVGDAAGAQPRVVRDYRRPLRSLAALRRRDVSLTIAPAATGGYDATLTANGYTPFHVPVETARLHAEIGKVRAALLRVVQMATPAGVHPFQDGLDIPRETGDAALSILATAGYDLFQLLFRHEKADSQCLAVAARLVEMAAKDSTVLKMQVAGAEFPVPWGVLYPVERFDPDALDWERFLGMRHVVEQVPLMPEMQGADVLIDEPDDGLSISLNLNRGIDREMSLDVVQRQEAYWARVAGTRPALRLTSRTRGAELLRALQDPATDDEVLYLYCHADSHALDDAGGPEGAALRLDAEAPLTLGMLKRQADTRGKLRGQPLVFINACESAQLTSLFYAGFVPYFINKGARGVIGTECSMPALFAAEWADAFFDAFLDGQPLGETVLALRRRFLADHGNPLGLLYGLHCDADTQLAPRVA